MSEINCNACDELREYAPDFVQNGVTNTVCNSMKNDTGINPGASVTHNDCEDLDTANDCLVGRMDGDLEAYDNCDWKKYMHKFVPNVYTVFKLMICAICGLWTNIHSLWSMLENMCRLLDALLVHPVHQIGTVPNQSGTYRCGVLGSRGGLNILVPRPHSELSDGAWGAQNAGIRYGTLIATNCETGNCQRYEWIAPDLQAYRFNPGITPVIGDVLWSVDKATLMSLGFTQAQWAAREANPIGWSGDFTAGTTGIVRVKIEVNNNRLEVIYNGIIGGDASNLPGKVLDPPADSAERLYRFSC